jgi:hypothetical protein
VVEETLEYVRREMTHPDRRSMPRRTPIAKDASAFYCGCQRKSRRCWDANLAASSADSMVRGRKAIFKEECAAPSRQGAAGRRSDTGISLQSCPNEAAGGSRQAPKPQRDENILTSWNAR